MHRYTHPNLRTNIWILHTCARAGCVANNICIRSCTATHVYMCTHHYAWHSLLQDLVFRCTARRTARALADQGNPVWGWIRLSLSALVNKRVPSTLICLWLPSDSILSALQVWLYSFEHQFHGYKSVSSGHFVGHLRRCLCVTWLAV